MTVCMLNIAAFLRNDRQIPLRHVEGLEMCNIIGLVGLITKVKLEYHRRETKAETRSCTKQSICLFGKTFRDFQVQ